jgi:peptidoglycan pentaglycine glycine transferase (the first glycine)
VFPVRASGYDVRLSRDDDDPAWDRFVADTPGGHHVQTTQWARVKAIQGWRAARVVLERDATIVAGAQLLVRNVPRVGAIAFAPCAPLTAGREPELLASALEAMRAAVRDERAIYLKLQPPNDRQDADPVLRAAGFVRSDLAPGPEATVRVDLRPEPDRLLAQMRSSTRSNIRKAQRKGVTVRAGGEEDLEAFYSIVASTGERQGFDAYPPAYYREIWRRFGAGGGGRLLLAELEGRVLGSIMVVGFRDSVIYKMGGWGGERGAVHPNELLHWTAMQWARDQGYRWYDFEGISVSIARALLNGEQDVATAGPARFKLGFGGEVEVFPSGYDYTYRRALAPLLRVMSPRLRRANFLAHRLLGRGS